MGLGQFDLKSNLFLGFVFVVVVRRLHPDRVLAADAEDAAGRLHLISLLRLRLLLLNWL